MHYSNFTGTVYETETKNREREEDNKRLYKHLNFLNVQQLGGTHVESKEKGVHIGSKEKREGARRDVRHHNPAVSKRVDLTLSLILERRF